MTPNSSFKSQTTSTTGANDTDSKPSASKSKAKNTSASSLLPHSTLSSDTSPSGQRRTLEDIDLGSYNPLQASGSEPVLSFESPDQSTEGVDEADGSKKGKDKEGVKVSWKESGEEREGMREKEGMREGEGMRERAGTRERREERERRWRMRREVSYAVVDAESQHSTYSLQSPPVHSTWETGENSAQKQNGIF